jgi:hypothetical protein
MVPYSGTTGSLAACWKPGTKRRRVRPPHSPPFFSAARSQLPAVVLTALLVVVVVDVTVSTIGFVVEIDAVIAEFAESVPVNVRS